MKRSNGFTLVEMMIAVVMIVVLAGLTVSISRGARQKARMVVEINAARNLIAGYLTYAGENAGKLLPGYAPDPYVTNLQGKPLAEPMNARYPWRLTPYVPKIEGVMLFNGNESALKAKESDYMVSVKPNLGLNATLVGGHFGTGSPLPPTDRLVQAYGKFYLSHLAGSFDPNRQIVFASARAAEGGPASAGYFEIRPPKLTSRVWSTGKFDSSSGPADHGFVDFRWDGKAVVAMLGGNVEVLNETQLRDMRRWSDLANRANDPDHLISASR